MEDRFKPHIYFESFIRKFKIITHPQPDEMVIVGEELLKNLALTSMIVCVGTF